MIGTVKEEALKLRQNLDKVYEAGKQAEYDRLVDPTKIIEETVTDSIIHVKDVSEIPHKCTVLADNDAIVTVCGKNLWCFGDRIELINVSHGDLLTFPNPLPIGTYTLSATIESDHSGEFLFALYYTDGSNSTNVLPDRNGSVTFTTNKPISGIRLYPKRSVTVGNAIYTDIQLEISPVSTAYEPYRGNDFTIATGQSIEVDSNCPTMILFTNNDSAITFNYRKSYGTSIEYDRFWDAYQQNGIRTDYRSLFSGTGWTEETFKPKYPIKPVGSAERMFCSAAIKHLDLKNIDWSAITYASYMFGESTVEHVGVVDLSNVTMANGIFYYLLNLHTIDKVILNANGTTKSNGSLIQHCYKLQNVAVEGMIAESLTMTNCNVLSRDSITSIVNALSTTTAGLTLSLPTIAVNNAFETSAGAADGSTSSAWSALKATRSNWTIDLI